MGSQCLSLPSPPPPVSHSTTEIAAGETHPHPPLPQISRIQMTMSETEEWAVRDEQDHQAATRVPTPASPSPATLIHMAHLYRLVHCGVRERDHDRRDRDRERERERERRRHPSTSTSKTSRPSERGHARDRPPPPPQKGSRWKEHMTAAGIGG